MTAEEIVWGGYAAFATGDMDVLGKIYHPECKFTFHGNRPLGVNIQASITSFPICWRN